MKAKDLIRALQAQEPDMDIQVYGYASNSAESEFELKHDLDSDRIILTPPYKYLGR